MTDMQDDNQDIQNVPSSSPNFKTELAKKLQELIPEAIADGKVDTQKLKELLADDSGDDTERFGLFWPGKKRAMRAAQEPTSATLKPAPDESKDWDTTKNLFIEGDNLEVLKVLQRQYHNKIKMIYIDPPYNTGKDFVYPDNFKEGLANYLEFTKQVDEGGRKISTNSDTEGRYHSNWLNMMYPRLKLARNLLTDDGVIFISIDDNEQDNLKKLCNEIFGENNFISTFIWKKKGTSTNVAGTQVSALTEYILAYSRGTAQSINSRIVFAEERVYPYSDDEGRYRTAGLEKKSTGDYNRESMKFEIIGHKPREGKRWQIGVDKAREFESRGRFIYDNDIVKLKIYDFEDTDSYSANPNLLLEIGSTQSGQIEVDSLMGGSLFDTPKPSSLIKHLTKIASHDDSLILDFFSGSGTTAQAVMQLNVEDGGKRSHIQVQLPEPTNEKSEAYKAGFNTIAQIARERIKRAGEKIKQNYAEKIAAREQPLDIGYRTYKLADTNFIKWQNTYTTDVTRLQARLDLMRESSNDNASQLDLLSEIVLKLGLELTTDVHQMALENLPIYNAAGGSLLLYLDEHIAPTLNQLRTILEGEHKPVKFVILEDSLKGDDQLKTNLTQICKSNSIELWTV